MNEKICLSNIVPPLLDWYAQNRRILPWREEPTPYHVWISEIMLQQTRVEAVKGYYERFMSALPDIQSLAGAEEQQLLKLWEGLGYYNRVRNLQKAAILIRNQYDGKMPADYETLLTLPGIGSYTAGAISSIAFGKNEAAVDGNVLRVISRVTADSSDISQEKVKRRMRGTLQEILPDGKAGMFNQALMDLGAVICVPNGEPLCMKCPWQEICLARRENKIAAIPYKSPKKARRVEKRTVLLIYKEDMLLLHKRPQKGLLAGLYEFPNVNGHLTRKGILDYVSRLGIHALHVRRIEDSSHIFSHIEWQMQAYLIKADELADGKASEPADNGYVFVSARGRQQYPVPSAFAAYLPYFDRL